MAKTKKNPSARKKLLSAIAMLTVSAVTLSTATYAWFTMNKNVKVTGMEVKTKVSGNLLICSTNDEPDYSSDTLTQVRKALLEPVSTITANDDGFYYTVDAAADGHKLHTAGSGATNYILYSENSSGTITGVDKYTAANFESAGAAKDKFDPAFNAKYGISGAAADKATEFGNAYGYVDYTFFLKATADADGQNVYLKTCNMIKTNADGSSGAALANTNNAWRVAVFAEEINEKGDKTVNQDITSTGKTAKSILTTANAVNFTSGSAVKDTSNTLGSVTYNSAATIDTIAKAGTTKYYKVVVRTWLEGEDTSCYSAYYAENPELYKLDLEFELGSETGVTNIGSALSS
jgi:hypothetical protein